MQVVLVFEQFFPLSGVGQFCLLWPGGAVVGSERAAGFGQDYAARSRWGIDVATKGGTRGDCGTAIESFEDALSFCLDL